jgi:hypothetical protein
MTAPAYCAAHGDGWATAATSACMSTSTVSMYSMLGDCLPNTIASAASTLIAAVASSRGCTGGSTRSKCENSCSFCLVTY